MCTHLLLHVGRHLAWLIKGTHDPALIRRMTGPMLIGRGNGRVAVVIRLLVR